MPQNQSAKIQSIYFPQLNYTEFLKKAPENLKLVDIHYGSPLEDADTQFNTTITIQISDENAQKFQLEIQVWSYLDFFVNAGNYARAQPSEIISQGMKHLDKHKKVYKFYRLVNLLSKTQDGRKLLGQMYNDKVPEILSKAKSYGCKNYPFLTSQLQAHQEVQLKLISEYLHLITVGEDFSVWKDQNAQDFLEFIHSNLLFANCVPLSVSGKLMETSIVSLVRLLCPRIIADMGDKKAHKSIQQLNLLDPFDPLMKTLLVFLRLDSFKQMKEYISCEPVGVQFLQDLEDEDMLDFVEEITGNCINPSGYTGKLVNKIAQVVKGLTPLGQIACPIRVFYNQQLNHIGGIILDGKSSLIHAVCVSIIEMMMPFEKIPQEICPKTTLLVSNSLTELSPNKCIEILREQNPKLEPYENNQFGDLCKNLTQQYFIEIFGDAKNYCDSVLFFQRRITAKHQFFLNHLCGKPINLMKLFEMNKQQSQDNEQKKDQLQKISGDLINLKTLVLKLRKSNDDKSREQWKEKIKRARQQALNPNKDQQINEDLPMNDKANLQPKPKEMMIGENQHQNPPELGLEEVKVNQVNGENENHQDVNQDHHEDENMNHLEDEPVNNNENVNMNANQVDQNLMNNSENQNVFQHQDGNGKPIFINENMNQEPENNNGNQ